MTSYKEYLEKSKQAKFNPEYLAPLTAKAPGVKRKKNKSDWYPPLDMRHQQRKRSY